MVLNISRQGRPSHSITLADEQTSLSWFQPGTLAKELTAATAQPVLLKASKLLQLNLASPVQHLRRRLPRIRPRTNETASIADLEKLSFVDTSYLSLTQVGNLLLAYTHLRTCIAFYRLYVLL